MRKLGRSRLQFQSYTLRVGNGRLYVVPTPNRNQGGALYQSVPHATTAIARKPDGIFTRRENRLETFHAKKA